MTITTRTSILYNMPSRMHAWQSGCHACAGPGFIMKRPGSNDGVLLQQRADPWTTSCRIVVVSPHPTFVCRGLGDHDCGVACQNQQGSATSRERSAPTTHGAKPCDPAPSVWLVRHGSGHVPDPSPPCGGDGFVPQVQPLCGTRGVSLAVSSPPAQVSKGDRPELREDLLSDPIWLWAESGKDVPSGVPSRIVLLDRRCALGHPVEGRHA